MTTYNVGTTSERDGLQPPRAATGRAMSNASVFTPRGSSLAPSGAPGSFSADLRSTLGPRAASRQDISSVAIDDGFEEDDSTPTEHAIAGLREMLDRELKMKKGSENLLDALYAKKAKQTKDQRLRVEKELSASNRKIGELQSRIEELQRPKMPISPPKSRLSNMFRADSPRSMLNNVTTANESESEVDAETESPTFVLAELLQALEADGMQPDYYVVKANILVELFKRHPNLKYDLAWSVFGLRVQMMLLSESKEVIAAGYRMTRYAMTDRKSLQTIRELNTDYLVMVSLIKEGKANVEREQALKFVRAFLDVKDGVREISCAVVRTIFAVAEHGEDRLRSICVETLAELLIRDTSLIANSGGFGPLIGMLGQGSYEASDSLATAFLYLLDMPTSRGYFNSGHGLDAVLSPFTDSYSSHGHDQVLKRNAKVLSTILKTWPGILTLSMFDFRSIRSLVASLRYSEGKIRDIILDLIFDLLRIKPPSWSSSFLAGRRLTTYGRVANLKDDSAATSTSASLESEDDSQSLVDHFTALMLTVLLEAGMLKELLFMIEDSADDTLRRKTTLLLGEILKIANRLLPYAASARLQVLPELFSSASDFGVEKRFIATSTVYQIDSVQRTLYRSAASSTVLAPKSAQRRISDPVKTKVSVSIDEAAFRNLCIDSQVLNSGNYLKWRWDIIQDIIDGPLLNPKRLDEAIRSMKFLKRVVGFYRPFKYRFCEVKNTRPNQRYTRVASSLIRTLLQTEDGRKYLGENKLLRQIAECLAQVDPLSGLTSQSPLFSSTRLTETLSSGYFAILGSLSKEPKGLTMLQQWKIFNMCYHIIGLKGRDDLIKIILGNMDYTIDSHFRVLLSKALTACEKNIRIYATNLLQKYATLTPDSQDSKVVDSNNMYWPIKLLITQLYDPEMEVCGTAVRVLEQACNRRSCLEYVVKCRPMLDHLGEIGAPLLLRFLSTSIGYHYLDDLDYINQEMDDWFLGRNDTYVTLVEASLARALDSSEQTRRSGEDGTEFTEPHGMVPPHFYRELTRTAEGCRLLQEKGHFNDFVSTIKDYAMEKDDGETILKVKGCMWAVGNVGSMELGTPFLEDSDVVECIVKIAESSEVMSMRGTAFFVLGLISRSIHGLEILNEYGWDSATSISGESLGFCLPLDLSRLFSIHPWPMRPRKDDEPFKAIKRVQTGTTGDPHQVRIVELITDLANTVLSKRAVSELMHLKAKKPVCLKETQFFREVMDILSRRHYRLPIRRFIVDLFDKEVLRKTVLDEESSSEGEGDLETVVKIDVPMMEGLRPAAKSI